MLHAFKSAYFLLQNIYDDVSNHVIPQNRNFKNPAATHFQDSTVVLHEIYEY